MIKQGCFCLYEILVSLAICLIGYVVRQITVAGHVLSVNPSTSLLRSFNALHNNSLSMSTLVPVCRPLLSNIRRTVRMAVFLDFLGFADLTNLRLKVRLK